MLGDLRERGVDAMVCLGDHAQGGPEPAECLELLRELGCPAVMGNSDHLLLTLDPGEEGVTEGQIENAEWSQSQLSDDLLAFHRSFEPTAELDLGDGRTLLAFHATPRSREQLVSPWMQEEEFRAPFEAVDATVFAGGHAHQQWARRLGDSYYVNPGSVGVSVDHLQSGPMRADVYAEYAILPVDGIRAPLEEALLEACIELGAHRRVAVEAGVLVGPLGRHRLEPVPRVLVEDQRPSEYADELVERAAKVVDVVQGQARDDGVERPWLVERLDRRLQEDRPLRRLRIDRDDLVAFQVQRPSQPALPTPDLEHPRPGRWQLRKYERGEFQGSQPRTGTADRRARSAPQRGRE